MVREKETGTAEQLMLTPLRRSEVVAAKMLPPFTVGMLSLVPSLGVLAWFDVPFRGSIALFVLASALALAACLAIGILISTFARTLQQPLRVLSLASPTPLHGDCAGRDTEGRWARSALAPVCRSCGNWWRPHAGRPGASPAASLRLVVLRRGSGV